jgi:hypothetical protein
MGTRPNEGGLRKKTKFNGQQAEERSAGFWNLRSMGGWGKRRKEMKLAGIKQGLTSSSILSRLINAKDEEWKKTALFG